MDDFAVAQSLDIAAGNVYFRMQDELAHPPVEDTGQSWMSAGAWSVFLSADRLFGLRHRSFLVTETNAGAIGASNVEEPGWDGQWRQVAWAMISRGARLIEYWHWHTNHVGAETHWVGVLPHDQKPGRVYENIAALGAEVRTHGHHVAETAPDADIAFVFSTPSKYALAFEPAFRDETAQPALRSYQRIVESFYKGSFSAGLQSHIVHDRDLANARGLRDRYAVAVVPGAYVLADDAIALLRDYVSFGGHLVIGPRTGYADQWARVRMDPQPGGFADLAGAGYQEFAVPKDPTDVAFADGGKGRAEGWIELLQPQSETTEVLATYRHPQYGSYAAATSRVIGSGRLTVIGFVPDVSTSRTLFSWVSDISGLHPEVPSAPTVTHSSASSEERRFHFYFNWSWEPAEIPWPEGRETLAGQRGSVLHLGPWDMKILGEHLGS